MRRLPRVAVPLVVVMLVVVVASAVLVASLAPAADATSGRRVMSASRLTGDQLAAWFKAHKPGKPCLTHGKKVRDIAKMFVREGANEGVRGDIAFAQSIIETGYFRYGGAVHCTDNNYAGIGATDSGGTPAQFPYPRIGIRAQIQHLRRYGDPTAKVKNLHKPLVDPRFRLVKPPGIAPHWHSFGNGIWATDPTYSDKVLHLYKSMRAYFE